MGGSPKTETVRMPPYLGCSAAALGVGDGAAGAAVGLATGVSTFGGGAAGLAVGVGAAAGAQLASNNPRTVKQHAAMKILLVHIMSLLSLGAREKHPPKRLSSSQDNGGYVERPPRWNCDEGAAARL